jgi:hypothetical protein
MYTIWIVHAAEIDQNSKPRAQAEECSGGRKEDYNETAAESPIEISNDCFVWI